MEQVRSKLPPVLSNVPLYLALGEKLAALNLRFVALGHIRVGELTQLLLLTIASKLETAEIVSNRRERLSIAPP